WLDLSPVMPEGYEEGEHYEKNILNIDFSGLAESESTPAIADMHRYFASLEGTSQNSHTGMFEGYNLIWIVAESFSTYTLSEEYTPTLYKLSHEGFVFDNFYNPVWYVSTSDGEYTTTTGLIPKSGVWSFSRSAKNYMPFGFGNMFRELGYTCYAFHNHTYTYYDRDSSHPNMGYDYLALGNGLEITKTWPESDIELMEKSLPYYIDADRFHTYYMTVSGHMNYNFMGNYMSAKHKSDVQPMLDAGYSEPACAYVACNMEFDQAMDYLIKKLDKAGVLDKTVIVISGDHYPYGLTVDEMEELNGGEIEENFELYRSTLIIWNSKMKTEHVSKYCYSIDIMPTLANLFGLKYDSRLVMGSDIFSDTSELVIFNNRSFICEKGRYDSGRDKFIWNEGCTEDNDYVVEMIQKVNDKFRYSAKILENDYYAKVLEREET
ncbi:MAG: LTA synthase family protein, partial [Oscillospiraceae bacterium]|nr:LTA synthase family protein [Oscillospiraceae bacterium]